MGVFDNGENWTFSLVENRIPDFTNSKIGDQMEISLKKGDEEVTVSFLVRRNELMGTRGWRWVYGKVINPDTGGRFIQLELRLLDNPKDSTAKCFLYAPTV